MTKKPKSASEIAALESDRRDAIEELGNQIAYNEGYQEHIGDLLHVMKPFVQLVKESSGRIQVEKLSLADWHSLANAFGYTVSCLDSNEKMIDRGNQIFALQNAIAAAIDSLKFALFHLKQSTLDEEGTYGLRQVESTLLNLEQRRGK